MTDPGGREAEIEAVARRLIESYSYFEPSDNDMAWRVARTAITALDAARGTEPLHQWLMRVVGSASTTPSAKRTVEAALDAVRCGSAARNQEDEVNRLANDLAGDWRERAERAEADVTMWKTRLVDETARLRELLVAARSPQSEDHEAGMKAMGVLMRDYDRNGGYHPTVKQLADAYRDAARSPQSEDHD